MVETHDDFPGVEISIAGGVGEMVRGEIRLMGVSIYIHLNYTIMKVK